MNNNNNNKPRQPQSDVERLNEDLEAMKEERRGYKATIQRLTVENTQINSQRATATAKIAKLEEQIKTLEQELVKFREGGGT